MSGTDAGYKVLSQVAQAVGSHNADMGASRQYWLEKMSDLRFTINYYFTQAVVAAVLAAVFTGMFAALAAVLPAELAEDETFDPFGNPLGPGDNVNTPLYVSRHPVSFFFSCAFFHCCLAFLCWDSPPPSHTHTSFSSSFHRPSCPLPVSSS